MANAAEDSGRIKEMLHEHANADKVDEILHLDVGTNVNWDLYIVPRYRWIKEFDGTYLSTIQSESWDFDRLNPWLPKEREGYKLKVTAADTSIIKVTSYGYSSYEVKGLKEGETVLRFYETYKDVTQYLGSRRVCVGTPDMTEDLVTIFVGSDISLPESWQSSYFYYDATDFKDENDKNPIPENKALFKKIKISKDYSNYVATKPGETKASIIIKNKKKVFRVKIIEPTISKNAKLEYQLYAGNTLNIWEYFSLFDSYLDKNLIKFVSDNPKVVKVHQNEEYNYSQYLTTEQPGTTDVKIYYKNGSTSKYIGKITIKVLPTTNSYITITDKIDEIEIDESYQCKVQITGVYIKPIWKVSDSSIASIDQNTGLLTGKREGTVTVSVSAGMFSKSFSVKVLGYVTITDMPDVMRVHESYQCKVEINRVNIKPIWKVSDSSIASIDQDTGLLTAKSEGTVTVSVTAGVCSKSFTVKVLGLKKIRIYGLTDMDIKNPDGYYEVDIFDEVVVWSLSDPSMATLESDSYSVRLNPLKQGKVILYVDTISGHGEITITIGEFYD